MQKRTILNSGQKTETDINNAKSCDSGKKCSDGICKTVISKKIAVGDTDKVKIYELYDGKFLGSLIQTITVGSVIEDLEFFPSDNKLLTLNNQGQQRIIDASNWSISNSINNIQYLSYYDYSYPPLYSHYLRYAKNGTAINILLHNYSVSGNISRTLLTIDSLNNAINSLEYFSNNPTLYGNFDKLKDFTEFSQSYNIDFSITEFKDIDGDGIKEYALLAKPSFQYQIFIYDINGNEEYTIALDPSNTYSSAETGAINFGDYDGDGDQDILVIWHKSSTSVDINLYLNDGSGNFTLSSNYLSGITVNARVDSVQSADFDGDGDIEAIFSTHPSFNSGGELHFLDGFKTAITHRLVTSSIGFSVELLE